MNKKYLYLFLASGVINGEGFWVIGSKDSGKKILDDKTLLECHRKELIGEQSSKDILEAINLNIDNFISDLRKNSIPLDDPPKGIPFNIPLHLLEEIFDFWFEKYKDQEVWEICFGLLKIRRRVSLTNISNNKSIKGDSKKWALEIENLHKYNPNSIRNDFSYEPMWK